jgi:hypothetical protein
MNNKANDDDHDNKLKDGTEVKSIWNFKNYGFVFLLIAFSVGKIVLKTFGLKHQFPNNLA